MQNFNSLGCLVLEISAFQYEACHGFRAGASVHKIFVGGVQDKSNLSMGGAKSRKKKKKKSFLMHKSAEFWKRIRVLYVSACFRHRIIQHVCIVLHILDVMKNTVYMETVLSLTLSQKGTFILYNENQISFCLKGGVLLDLKINYFSWKGGGFFRPISAKRFFPTCIRAWMYPESKVHGANMGSTWVLSAPDGPHIGTMNLAIRVRFARKWGWGAMDAMNPRLSVWVAWCGS